MVGEEHLQVEHGHRKLGSAHGLKLLFEGERSIFTTGFKVETVAGYLLTFFNKFWFHDIDDPGRGEVERFCSIQASEGKELRPVANEGGLEFVSDKAFTPPSEGLFFTGEGGG